MALLNAESISLLITVWEAGTCPHSESHSWDSSKTYDSLKSNKIVSGKLWVLL